MKAFGHDQGHSTCLPMDKLRKKSFPEKKDVTLLRKKDVVLSGREMMWSSLRERGAFFPEGKDVILPKRKGHGPP